MTWTQTFTETKFSYENIWAGNVHLEDIAHALSHLCRFNGHTNSFYSVAQHSVHVASIVPDEFKMEGLMHDAAEAYIGDMPRPLKQMMLVFKEMEFKIMVAVRQRYQLEYGPHVDHQISLADNIALATEARDLMNGDCIWAKDLGTPDIQRIIPLAPMEAKEQFLDTFHNIMRQR